MDIEMSTVITLTDSQHMMYASTHVSSIMNNTKQNTAGNGNNF